MKITQIPVAQILALVLSAACVSRTMAASQSFDLGNTSSSPALEVVLDELHSLINDGSDTLYLNDGTGAIGRFNFATGLISVFPLKQSLPNLGRIILGDSGKLLGTDTSNCSVVEISQDGSVKIIAGGKRPEKLPKGRACGSGGDGGPAMHAFFEPDNLALDGDGNILIIDVLDRRIRKVDRRSGIMTTLIAPSQLTGLPSNIACNKQGDLYISEGGWRPGRYPILRLDHKTGSLSALDSKSFHGEKTLWSGSEVYRNVFIDPSGENLYVEDQSRIFYIDLQTRNVSLVAGQNVLGFSGDGGPATLAQLKYPSDLTFDSHGDLYINDYGNYRIRRIDAKTHIITTVAGKVGPD